MKITENTSVTLTVLIVIIGGVMWFQTLYSLASTTADKVAVIEARQDKYSDDIIDIKKALSRIEGKMEK